MLKKSVFFIFAVLTVSIFAWGLARLFLLRFESGDVYPPGSPLRADPLGIKAFPEALRVLPGLEVRENFRPLVKIQTAPGTTIFQASASRHDWDNAKELSRLAKHGARVVVAFEPEIEKSFSAGEKKEWDDESNDTDDQPSDTKAKDTKVKPDKESKNDAKDKTAKKDILPCSPWGVAIERLWGNGATPSLIASKNPDIAGIEPTVPCHSALYFDKPGEEWKVIYSCGDKAVMIEKKTGQGSVLLASDSYFLSNEALSVDRRPRLLAWLAGTNNHILFDETHLGLEDSPGAASLARKYRMHGLSAGLLILALLFVWKNAVPFLPAGKKEETDDAIAGKDAAEGFVNLLRRGIPPGEILKTCFDEWKKTYACQTAADRDKLARIETIVKADAAQPVRNRRPDVAYQAIAKILTEKN